MVLRGNFSSICEKLEYDEIHMHHIEFSDIMLHILLRVLVKIVDKPNNYIHYIPLLVKIPRKQNLLDTYAIKSEMTLYNVMEKYKNQDSVVPRCYRACFWNITRLPIVVLEDITENGYKQLEGKLNVNHMKICMKHLGKFHGSALNLFKENRTFSTEEQINTLKTTVKSINNSAVR